MTESALRALAQRAGVDSSTQSALGGRFGRGGGQALNRSNTPLKLQSGSK